MTTAWVRRDEFRIVNSFALHWVKEHLKAVYRQARAAGQPSPLKESDGHLLLLIATYVREGNVITDPIPLQDLNAAMQVERNAVREARLRLEALGELKQLEGGQGVRDARFQFLKMSGELFEVEGIAGETATPGTRTRHVPLATFKRPPTAPLTEVAPTSIPVPAPSLPLDPTNASEGNVDPTNASDLDPTDRRAAAPAFVGSTLAPDDYVLHINNNDRTSSLLLDKQAERFAHWWAATVRQHTERAPSRLERRYRKGADQQTDLEIVRELLEEYPFETLQAMTIMAWTIQRDGRKDADWIAKSDGSIRVVRANAVFLNDEVERQLRARDEAPNVALWTQICERLLVKVDRHRFHTWFAPCCVRWVRGTHIIICAPSEEHRDLLEKFADGLLLKALTAAVAEAAPGHSFEFHWFSTRADAALG